MSVYDFVSDVFLFLDFFIFLSSSVVLDHVIKLFIVLYHALKRGHFGLDAVCVWTVCFPFFSFFFRGSVRQPEGPE